MKSTLLPTLMFLSITLISSCGSNDDDDSATVIERQEDNEKNLFSRWSSESGFILDLTNGTFNTPTNITFFFQDGSTCNCGMTITGTQSSGEIDLSTCFYTGGGNGDPGCAQLDDGGPGTYTKSPTDLRICSPECATLR